MNLEGAELECGWLFALQVGSMRIYRDVSPGLRNHDVILIKNDIIMYIGTGKILNDIFMTKSGIAGWNYIPTHKNTPGMEQWFKRL